MYNNILSLVARGRYSSMLFALRRSLAAAGLQRTVLSSSQVQVTVRRYPSFLPVRPLSTGKFEQTPTLKSGEQLRNQLQSSSVFQDNRQVEITWKDGHVSSFHAKWLRHNCQCPDCLSSSGQKLVRGRDLQGEMIVLHATVSGASLNILWECGPVTHSGHIELQMLRRNCYSASAQELRRQRSTPLVAHSIPFISGKEVLENDKALWRWLKYLNDYGLCVVTDVPTKLGEVKTLGERISHIQKTIYGEVFDVVSMESPVNIAYTSLPLMFHVDLAYYESPPGLQLLHCVRNDPCVKGGESLLVDAFPVVEELRQKHPQHFETLLTVPATFQKIHYERAEPVEMKYQRPHITVDSKGRITGVNWSPPFEGPLCVSEEDVDPYYEAYNCLAEMFEQSELKLTHRLQPGEALTFNNRRVLHARSAIELCGGVRHLQGLYINIDEFKSKFQVLSSRFADDDDPVKHVFNQCLF